MSEAFMFPSYTATFIPIPVAGDVASDWPALTETDAVVAADAGRAAAAIAPTATSATAAEPSAGASGPRVAAASRSPPASGATTSGWNADSTAGSNHGASGT